MVSTAPNPNSLDREWFSDASEHVNLWRHLLFVVIASGALCLMGCAERKGDEIVVAGKLVHTGTRVVLWSDPGGYDAYQAPDRETQDTPAPGRYGIRKGDLTPDEIERIRTGDWDVGTLQRVVDKFVIHYDAVGTSYSCFRALQNRDLSIHFMLDVDGTIYQTLDVKERAFHTKASDDRSIGIEIANLGAYGISAENPFSGWYQKDGGQTVMVVPEYYNREAILHQGLLLRPARPEPVVGEINRRKVTQYDFTPEQYEALAKLTATLCGVFPKITCDYPRDANGLLFPRKLPDAEIDAYQGVIGHYHLQASKTDPGPAFQWEYVMRTAQGHLRTNGPLIKLQLTSSDL